MPQFPAMLEEIAATRDMSVDDFVSQALRRNVENYVDYENEEGTEEAI